MASMAAVAAAATGALLLVAAFAKLLDQESWRQLVVAVGGDGTAGRFLRIIAAVLGAYDFAQFGTIADIGGGGNHLLRAVLDAVPSDRARRTERSRREFQANAARRVRRG